MTLLKHYQFVIGKFQEQSQPLKLLRLSEGVKVSFVSST
jgi:hypothetical protein